jgi:hypothetical protein
MTCFPYRILCLGKKDDLRDKAEGRDAVFAVFKVTNRKSQTIYTLSGDKI